MSNQNALYALAAALLFSCSTEKGILSNFETYRGELPEISRSFANDELGRVEVLDCYDSLLVTFDYQQGYMYGLFNSDTGRLIRRFGKVGQGEKEIPMGTWGKMWRDTYYVFSGYSEVIFRYSNLGGDEIVIDRIPYRLPNSHFSQIAPVDDQQYLGMGVYNDRYHYAVFDRNSVVTDSLQLLDELNGPELSPSQRRLVNQGKLIRCADRPLFVSTLNYSSNIDFIEVTDGKMSLLSSYSGKDLALKPKTEGTITSAHPTGETINGFLDLAGTDRYVFALYSDELVADSPYCSSTLLIFDWKGRMIRKVFMKSDIYCIAAYGDTLYTVEKEEGENVIKSYRITF